MISFLKKQAVLIYRDERTGQQLPRTMGGEREKLTEKMIQGKLFKVIEMFDGS